MLLAGLKTLSASPRDEPSTPITQQLAVPAYINPSTNPQTWSRLIDARHSSVGIVVANVLNGPADQVDNDWSSAIDNEASRGVTVLGYVDTGYFGSTGERTTSGSSTTADWLTQIEADVNTWYSLYGSSIGGIFFDKATNSCGPVTGSDTWAELYTAASAYVKKAHPGALTVMNPGTAVPQCYENAADVLLTFEGSYSEYTAPAGSSDTAYRPNPWVAASPMKIWHLVYDVPSIAQMEGVLRTSRERGAGYVFATDAGLPNPYDALPPDKYWLQEQAHVNPTGP